MARDIDHIIERLKTEIPGTQITQLEVAHPGADDDGLWFIRVPGRAEEVQIESTYGSCPFLIESDFGAERFQGHTIDEVVSTVKTVVWSALSGRSVLGGVGPRALPLAKVG